MIWLESWSAGALWLATAIMLAIAELIAPGFFLIFVAAGAGVTGLILLLAPGIGLVAQALLFAACSGVAIAIGGRWYRRHHRETAPNGLNDRAGKLIGRTVEVCEAIVGGEGRVRVGDGTWNAKGPDAPAGALVRIAGSANGALLVEPAPSAA
ncbi:MAG: NfeD family protein [Pseudomonadota bacterium]|nr:NfeD family protein [Pseudomonadota bacterium]